jgi:hypothetical protein
MYLTWHIVLKDLHRLWLWLALLVVAILARYLHAASLDYQNPALAQNDYWSRAGFFDGALLGLVLLATCLTAAALVHEDPVTGDRAFWTTRPISGARLLAAKTILLVLTLILVPLLLQLAWWFYHGFNSAEIAALIPAMLTRQAATAGVSFFCALLTRSLGSFILTTIISLLVVIGLMALIENAAPKSWRTHSDAREFLEPLVALTAATICIIWQYRTRRTRVTLGIIAASFLVCAAINAFWQWPIFAQGRNAFDRFPRLSPTAVLPTDFGKIVNDPQSTSTTTQFVNGTLHFSVTLQNLPADSVVEVLPHRFPDTSLAIRIDYEDFLRITAPPHTPLPCEQTIHFKLADDYARDPSRHALNAAREVPLHLLLRRLHEVARLPLTPGAKTQTASRTLKLTSKRSLPPGVDPTTVYNGKVTRPGIRRLPVPTLLLTTKETQPAYLIDPDTGYAERNVYYLSSLTSFPNHGTYFLVSRDTAIPASSAEGRAGLTTDGLQQFEMTLQFPVSLTDADLAGYELIKVIAPAVGTFTRTLTFPPTRLTEPATP